MKNKEVLEMLKDIENLIDKYKISEVGVRGYEVYIIINRAFEIGIRLDNIKETIKKYEGVLNVEEE